jgi:hypothetical protein
VKKKKYQKKEVKRYMGIRKTSIKEIKRYGKTIGIKKTSIHCDYFLTSTPVAQTGEKKKSKEINKEKKKNMIFFLFALFYTYCFCFFSANFIRRIYCCRFHRK